MKATLRIENRTGWRSDHLRAFAVRAREQVFGDEWKSLVVRFLPSRTRMHGRAGINGHRSAIWLPEPGHRKPGMERTLAMLLVHEFAHNAGARGERWMRRSRAFGWGEGWEQTVAWADTLPLEAKLAAPVPSAVEQLERKLAHVQERQRAWATKAKRAATALRKLNAAARRLERRMAALEVKP